MKSVDYDESLLLGAKVVVVWGMSRFSTSVSSGGGVKGNIDHRLE